jgi:HAD superfamily hydrolase (TIGR01509 family)
MIKAICFDAEGVILEKGGMNKFHQYILDLHISNKDLEHVLYFSEEAKKFRLGNISETAFWSFANTYWNTSLEIQTIKNLIKSGYEINFDVRNEIQLLKNNQYKVALWSNDFITRAITLEDKFKFSSLFDSIHYSFQAQSMKPEKEFFLQAVGLLCLNNNEVLYIDDELDKVSGAIEIGMHAHQASTIDDIIFLLKKYKISIN